MRGKVYPFPFQRKTVEEALNTATAIIILLYVAAGLLAILLAPIYVANQLTLFENPENPVNILYLMLTIVLVFIIILIIVKLRLEILFKGLFYFSAFTVLTITISVILPNSPFWLAVAVLTSVSIMILLNRFYKWYVADAVGVFLSASIAAWFGASLTPPVLTILLLLMAVYDYFAVRSGGMVSLAEKTLKMNLPTMVMSPVKEVPKDFKTSNGERRGAFLGLGDLAFPNMLTVSTFLETGSPVAAMIVLSCSAVGLVIVLYAVRRFKKPQPGLPYIGLGAALGWIVSKTLV
ncbi:MAG: presenilin family intramembrane aspartyl protease PSH [Thermoproteota archaeon]